MRIHSLKVHRLHGAISQELVFAEGVTILVGANGSGKTSMLNLIGWLLQPMFPRLCTTNFESVVLRFTDDKKVHELTCAQLKGRLTYSLKIDGKEPYKAIEAVFEHDLNRLSESPDAFSEALGNYEGLSPDDHEKPLYNYIRQLEKPRLINLDRRVEYGEDTESESGQKRGLRKSNPLQEARRLTSVEYGKHKSSVIRFGEQLQQAVILSSFSIGEKALASETSAKTKISIQTLQERINRLIEKGLFHQSADKTFQAKLRSAAESFFAQARLSQGQSHELELQRIQKITEIFTKYEKQTEGSLARIRGFLDRVNGFLSDSKKRIFFDEDTNRLFYCYENESGIKRDVSYLSSGERQIVILFAYIAFMKGAVILVDEPEVSLHPRWQEQFLEIARELMLPHTQLILASHSPAIVGRNIANVMLLE